LQALAHKSIPDDPKPDPPIAFQPGIISYAGSGPNSRTSQLFISYGSAKSLGTQLWETPIGKGMSLWTNFFLSLLLLLTRMKSIHCFAFALTFFFVFIMSFSQS
jgi:cyclophilin family peptidyl-prolyl cis-trans isomerase